MHHKRLHSIGGGDAVGFALPKRPKVEQAPPFWSDLTGDPSLAFSSADTIYLDQDVDKSTNGADTPKASTLSATDLPASATKIYVVKRGYVPGFYYDWPSCQRQVNGYRDNLYMSFPQGKKASVNAANRDMIIKDAVEYMNHNSTSCTYKCGNKCRDVAVSVLPTASLSCAATILPSLSRAIIEPAMGEGADHNICDTCCKYPANRGSCICVECQKIKEAESLSRCIARSNLKYVHVCLEQCRRERIADSTFSPEQAEVLNSVASGRNVFFTGAAGTGKSRVIEAIVAFLRDMGWKTHVVAPTGMAAINVYGTTVHAYAGWTVKISEGKLDDLVNIAHERNVWKRTRQTDVLIIDEISMLSSDMFKRLSFQMSESRNCEEPFGGVQLIITGDFFQLPPVLPFKSCLHCGKDLLDAEDGKLTKIRPEHGQFHDENKWPFRSNLWRACDFVCIQLTVVHRQTDSAFTQLLHDIRQGRWTEDHEKLLLQHPNSVVFADAIKLTPLRKEAENMNDWQLRQLPAVARQYMCDDDLHWKRNHAEFVLPSGVMSMAPLENLRHHTFAQDLELKEGMQVILLHNLDIGAGLVNGTTGTIVGFKEVSKEEMPRAQESRKDTSTAGERLITHEHRHYAGKRIQEFCKSNDVKELPIVCFKSLGNGESTTRMIYPYCSFTELGHERPFSLLSRTQIPLIAGWAITIHKSQGMTLGNVVVALDRAFSPGMAYVALSRARSLETMIVQTLPARKYLMPDETVAEFMHDLFG